MGRPRKIIELCSKHNTKADIEARKAGQQQFKVGRDSLAPPGWLNPLAKEEFRRVVQEAAAADFLDNLDLGMLTIYAYAWSRYVQITRYIESADSSKDAGEIGYKFDHEGNELKVLSPYVTAMNAYAKQIMQCSTKLGMATTDRLKLVVPSKALAPENPILEFLAKNR